MRNDQMPTQNAIGGPGDPAGLSLEEWARHLAHVHSASRRPGTSSWVGEHLDSQEELLREAHTRFVGAAEETLAGSYTAEWLLDNFHIVLRTFRQIAEDLKDQYYRELPKLDTTDLTDRPRVYAIAQATTRLSGFQLGISPIESFITAYQEVAPLTIGEIWALPTMLRLVVLEYLTQAVVRAADGMEEEAAQHVATYPLPEDVTADDVTAGSIISLRALDAEDWKDFFEDVSLVDRLLRNDPAGVYAAMDFETRDRYRKRAEKLALATGREEVEVARAAVELADADPGEDCADVRRRHVGYYLIGDGGDRLDARLGYHPAWYHRISRWLLNHPTLTYLGSVLALAAALLVAMCIYALGVDANSVELAGILVVTLVPAITISASVVNWAVTHVLPPAVLPKLDFRQGTPPEYRTLVVIPAMLSSDREVDSLLRQLELHYVRNPDPNFHFALLSDFTDAPEKHMRHDKALLHRAAGGIRDLNRRYPRTGTTAFFLLHRERLWNPQEDVWMGWERKRGKLEELNRLILNKGETSFSDMVGDLDVLTHIRYVITLDADTILPLNSGRVLVGALAHPLNRAKFDPDTGRVVAGYTILQPRTEVQLAAANRSLFTRIFAGDNGLDPYTRAVSDVYQDLFGEGIYVGKGIYDVSAFESSLTGQVPDNVLLSHDLLEGIHGRVGLVTDIVLYEDYPPTYLAYTHRLRRWVRGDWQLLPWLFPRPRRVRERTRPAVLTAFDRWRILDNLRRTLIYPALILLLVCGWLILPGSALVWTLLGLVTLGSPLFTSAVNGLSQVTKGTSLRGTTRRLRSDLLRWLLATVFLPYEALISTDAIARTLTRVLVTRTRLLEWTTASRAARRFGGRRSIGATIQNMNVALVFSVVTAALVGWLGRRALPAAVPVIISWAISPLVAHLISQPIEQGTRPLSAEQTRYLRTIARRTWLFFEQFVGPEDRWLPPDHFQQDPQGLVAHRTSPTNIGLTLVATLSACEFGYIELMELVLRVRDAFSTMDTLERHRGHFLNWYNTETLEPLPPRYVSTVDSGNLAASLLALDQGCAQLRQAPIPRTERWDGFIDGLEILIDTAAGLPAGTTDVQHLADRLRQVRDEVLTARGDLRSWAKLLRRLSEEEMPQVNGHLVTLVGANGEAVDAATLHSLLLWMDRSRHQLATVRREMDMLAPWLPLLDRAPERLRSAEEGSEVAKLWLSLVELLSTELPQLAKIGPFCARAVAALSPLSAHLSAHREDSDKAQAALDWCYELEGKLESARSGAESLLRDLEGICERARSYADEFDYGFLFDEQRELFHIGYNVDTGTLDASYYDLLASEARTTSLLAVGKGDVPASHWVHLARPLTDVGGRRTLLSWSGTMFEYLMPHVFMVDYDQTLLNQSNRAAVRYQVDYGRERGVPWGISESGYYRFDAAMNYQYRAFGIPGLGFKRGLGDDLVVTPYASLLALGLVPHEVMRNIERFAQMGMLTDYGFYEAIDFTPGHLTLGQEWAIVRSFMAHHQGMIMLALANYLKDDQVVRWFHANPLVQSVELLLQERIPYEAPLEEMPEEEGPVGRPAQPQARLASWQAPADAPFPVAHYLSNGRYAVFITNSGGGFSRWEGRDITRWRADTTRDNWGSWIYIQDQDSGRLWSATQQPTAAESEQQNVLFYPHKVEFQCGAHGIASRLEVTVPPDADVEIRRLRLRNQSGEARRLAVTSYAEVTLADKGTDQRHPAFNKLFVTSEYRAEDRGLLFSRRLRGADEKPIHVAHTLLVEQDNEVPPMVETDRRRFLGRGRSCRNPQAFDDVPPRLSATTGPVLDPIMALGQQVELAPYATAELVYVTSAAEDPGEAMRLATRYRDRSAIERAFDRARSQSEVELRQIGITSPELEHVEYLLSLLHYPYRALRAEPSVLARNSEGQSRLWPYAISGDYPILLARIHTEEETALVRELLRAHRYWRNRNLQIDLVILNEQESGYNQELQGQLQQLLVRTQNEVWLQRRGGIFVILADQMDQADRDLLASAARVILDGEKGPVAAQMQTLFARAPALPAFIPETAVREPEATPPPDRPGNLLFDNGLGGFTPDGREYIVYLEPGSWTPSPWINVIANPEYGFIVSEGGSMQSWAGNSGENRLTPWSNDPVSDEPGEALYLRDEETGEIWTPTPVPCGAPGPCLVRHGAGYTVLEHNSYGLKHRLRVFAVVDAPVKVVALRLENSRDRPRRLTATYFAQWVLGVHRDQMQQYVIPEYDSNTGALLARNPYNVEFRGRLAFLAASEPPHGVTADRTEFLGRTGTLARPAALDRIGLSSRVEAGVDPCAALQLHVELEPGGTREVYFLLGQGEDREETLQLIRRHQDPRQVAEAWQAVGDYWDDVLGTVTVDTPDPAMDVLINRWLLYQDLSCRIWGRSALYQPGGAFGFRDQLQDMLAVLLTVPELAREHILRSAAHQFEAGDVLHWWHPPSGRGVRTRISDDLLWLPFVVARYVESTGDRAILSEERPFLVSESLEADEEERYGHYTHTSTTYSLFEHCLRALDKGDTQGDHGLPLIGTGDWNDGMNHVGNEGRGESVWLGWFLYANLSAFSDICEQRGETGQAEQYRRRAAELRQALEDQAWDGEWYLRAFYDDGTPLGSLENMECQIDSIAQSWAVISGGADPERMRRAMAAVGQRLLSDDAGLIRLFAPPFDETPRDPGYIKGYPPGIRENGGQYTHAAIWTIWAYAELGQGDRAEALFRMINPIYHADTPEKVARYRVEPYVMAADVYSERPHVGRGGWTWYTGSGGWMYQLGLHAILGLRREGDVLRIEPCIPRDWSRFEMTVRHGDAHYHIDVRNPDGANCGVSHVELDGENQPERTIPLSDDGQAHEVTVIMGR